MQPVEVDDHVSTPFGDARVAHVERQSDTVLVQYLGSGLHQTFKWEEFEEPDDAPLDDPQALSEWLDRNIRAMVIPCFRVADDVWRCESGEGCECSHCYTIERRLERMGEEGRTQFTHMTDNELCRCRSNGCGCA